MICITCKQDSSSIQICDSCAGKLVVARNKYSYPPVYVKDYSGNISYDQFETTGEVESYNRKLLASDDQEEVFRGLCSVIFWGFFSHGKNFALNRVDWFLHGNGNKRGLDQINKDYAELMINSAVSLIDRGNSTDAIRGIAEIPWLMQVSFSSKVCMFINPDACAVHDSQIHKRFNFISPNSGGVSKQKAKKYQIYCDYLGDLATALNSGIKLGREWLWLDELNQAQQWRIADVERAFFSLRP